MPNDTEPKPVSVPDSYSKAATELSQVKREVATLFCLEVLIAQNSQILMGLNFIAKSIHDATPSVILPASGIIKPQG